VLFIIKDPEISSGVIAMSCSIRKQPLWFKACLVNQPLIEKLKKISLVVSDVDGSLTDGKIYVSENGEGGRQFYISDGYIFNYVQKAGIKIALISGKNNKSTLHRGKTLGVPIELCLEGKLDKISSINLLQTNMNITPEQTLFFGDDHLDVRVKTESEMISLYACPQNAPFYLQQPADIVVPANGGEGAFRLLMDLLLYIKGQHFAQDLIDSALR